MIRLCALLDSAPAKQISFFILDFAEAGLNVLNPLDGAVFLLTEARLLHFETTDLQICPVWNRQRIRASGMSADCPRVPLTASHCGSLSFSCCEPGGASPAHTRGGS